MLRRGQLQNHAKKKEKNNQVMFSNQVIFCMCRYEGVLRTGSRSEIGKGQTKLCDENQPLLSKIFLKLKTNGKVVKSIFLNGKIADGAHSWLV